MGKTLHFHSPMKTVSEGAESALLIEANSSGLLNGLIKGFKGVKSARILGKIEPSNNLAHLLDQF
ncbi:hypothetical protein Scep_002153 [Stephania cephalantha]|uniref:Uncharacterized protein n=1 Tax=Stephania cephalantha TaxID=152367 RepID=A0AAP0L9F2_9MAGN